MSMPKNLEILYFATLAEQAGKDEEKIQFAGETVSELYQYLSTQYHFTLAQSKLAIAINHEITDWQATIANGDVVAFIPPVAGG